MSKRRNKKITQKSFMRMAASSALGIFVCVICLAGMTWAWFTDSATSMTNNITFADFSVEITVKDISENPVNPGTDGIYNLSAGKSYKITVESTGSATTGYCKVRVNETDYFTKQLMPKDEANKSVSFPINCTGMTSETKVTFTPIWGVKNDIGLIDQDTGIVLVSASSAMSATLQSTHQPDNTEPVTTDIQQSSEGNTGTSGESVGGTSAAETPEDSSTDTGTDNS